MAKRKVKTRLEEVQDFVSNEKKIIEDIIKPALEDHLAEKVRNLRSQGYDNNKIAAMFMISRHKIDNIK